MRGVKIKHLCFFLILVIGFIIFDQAGILLHLNADDYYKKFQYPMAGDIHGHMDRLRRGQESSVKPINPHNYLMKTQAKGKCIEEISDDLHRNIRVVYLVKSALNNFERRKIIRKTWGYEK
jgi:hypothetical protein